MVCQNCGKEISPYYPFCPNCKEPVKKWAVIQLETTGLKPKEGHEILKIIIMDQDGNVALNSLFKPIHIRTWPDAESKNKISPQMVASAKKLEKEELKRVNDIIAAFSVLIANSSSFVKSFLDAAHIKHPQIRGISELFREYQENEHIILSTKTDVCAKYFHYDEQHMQNLGCLEKIKKVWFCYQNLNGFLAKDKESELIGIMGKEYEINGIKYQRFISQKQAVDYLKHLKVCSLLEHSPILYYDGRYMPEPTYDVFIIGLKKNEQGKADRVILCVKDRTVCMKLEAFLEMQKRKPKAGTSCEINLDDSPSIFDLCES